MVQKFVHIDENANAARTQLDHLECGRVRAVVILHKNLRHIGLKFVYYDEKIFCAK